MVSEFMLQQTPVDRVLPVWAAWLASWPSAPDLAASTIADALRAWGRLGYPRRARRLHESAVIITRDFGGEVPNDADALRSLPGVGEYTAAALLAFAFEQRSVVMDTNVRRVLARAIDGTERPTAHITAAERARGEDLWPHAHRRSARWSAAVMELGAVVCTARRPACEVCPLSDACAWTAMGRPVSGTAVRRQARYEGSDRQARGSILDVLRRHPDGVPASVVEAAWPDGDQRTRALAGLVDDGLAIRLPNGGIGLPT
jgi:A/G-specific adenine glycosylase